MRPDPPLSAVVFDLDGLMFNTEELYQHVGSELLRRRGKVWTEELLHAMMGRPAWDALQRMIDAHRLDDTVAQLQAETEAMFPAILDQRLAPMPGLIDLLDDLRQAGLPVAIATSSGRAFLEDVLGRFNLADRFQFTLTAQDVAQGKPHPEIYRTAAQRLAVPSAQMMVLEDSQTGCTAAVAAGAFAVAVRAGHNRTHDFHGARLIADSLEDPRIREALGLPLRVDHGRDDAQAGSSPC